MRPGPGRWEPDGRPAHLREACEASLRRLRLDQIPLYQFHHVDPTVPLGESIGALVELKAEGKIRHIGVSNVTESELRKAEKLTPVVSIQEQIQRQRSFFGTPRGSVRTRGLRLPALGTHPRF